MVFQLGERLVPLEKEEGKTGVKPAVYITNSKHAKQVMEDIGMLYEGEAAVSEIGFCKMESQQECLSGSLCIPKLLDVLGSRYRILFFIDQTNLLLIDDDDFSKRIIRRIQRKKTKQGETKEKFVYNFISEIITRDLVILGQYEKTLMGMEEDISRKKTKDFQSELMPIRRKLLTLRSYYDEIADMGRELEENENEFFSRDQLKYFGTITDRAERLQGKTEHLLEYAGQVKDAYQAQIDARQNSNMQFLTVISTIFFPLTLITGWYGMNFQNMPELRNGYPGVIFLSLVVIVVCIIIFKKKNIF